MMIQANINLTRTQLEKKFVKTKEDFKLQFYNELTIEMQNKMRAELDVARTLWKKELDTIVLAFTTWKSETEKRIKGK